MSTKLFVDEDEDDEIRPSPSVNQVSLLNEDAASNLDEHDSDDDPIISEIPIILKKKPSNQKLHVLQYPGRPAARPFIESNKIVEARLKADSNLMEVDTSIDTTKFYDSFKSEEWGGVTKQSLQGVLLELDGYYTANMKQGELILIPLDSTAQLRPHLKHIDREVAEKKELNKAENPNTSGVQVVHMTVKNSSDNAPRLGGALLARKKVDESEFEILKWYDLNDQQTERVRQGLLDVEFKQELHSVTKSEDFIKLLVKDTVV